MVFDWAIRITDLVTIIALLAGPIVAVQLAEMLRKRQDLRNRKRQIFRTLMATRSATLTPHHIEALNLVEAEFYSGSSEDRKVIDSWKLYLAHLNDTNYPLDAWGARRSDLLVELLYDMS